MTTSPSLEWHYWIFFIAVTWLLISIARGWRLGLIRALLKFMTLVAAWVGGAMAAAFAMKKLAIFFNPPPSFLPKIAATLAGITIFMVGNFLAGVLFKRTQHHRGIIRWILGMGGAFWGLLYGLAFLWAGIALIRGFGTMGERHLMEARAQGRPLSSDPTSCNLVRLKGSLEMGMTGHLLLKLDPFSSSFYQNGTKAAVVVKNPEMLARFFESPSIQELFQHPRLVALLEDPEVQQALKSGNSYILLQNKKIQSAFHDSEIIKALKSFNFSSALDYALTKPLFQSESEPSLLEQQRPQRMEEEQLDVQELDSSLPEQLPNVNQEEADPRRN